MAAVNSSIRVAIIGAGPAGLCALKHLTTDPSQMFSPVVFERNARLGGTWLYTNDTSKIPLQSAVYDNLKTNLPKEVMHFPGFPFPDNLPSFIHHSDCLKYFESFADHFKLHSFIKFNTEVVQVLPKCQSSTRTEWKVSTRGLKTGEEEVIELFDAVIVCNGHHTVPYCNIDGLTNFKGSVIHSQKYRNSSPYESKDVLIAGGASSGVDITLEVATTARNVYLSQSRRGILSNVSAIPSNIFIKPRTSCISNDGSVVLSDGSTIQVDSIILCTGYQYDFPFLSEECGISLDNNRLQPLYKHIFNINYPSMAFIGLNFQIVPNITFDVQMSLVCAVFTNRVNLPEKDAMVKDEELDFQSKISSGLTVRDAHWLSELQWIYFKELAMVGCFDVYDPIYEKIYTKTSQLRSENVVTYKNHRCTIDKEKCVVSFVLP